MNPKHFHTPVSTRMRCPVCHQPVYSRGGIHPQCAMRQSEPALARAGRTVEMIAEDQKVVVAGLCGDGAEDARPPKYGPRLQPSKVAQGGHGLIDFADRRQIPSFQPLGSLISLL